MFTVSPFQNGTCRLGWVTQSVPAFCSLSLSYSNDINCALQGQEMCPFERIQPPYASDRALLQQNDLWEAEDKKDAAFKSAKAEFDYLITDGFLTYIYDLTAEIIT